MLVIVRVNQRADAFVGKYLGQQPFIHAAVDDVDARHAGLARGDGMKRLGNLFRRDVVFLQRDDGFKVGHRHLPDDPALNENAILRGDENQFDGLQRLRHRDCDAVGIYAIRLAVAVETERRDDRHNALREQRLEQFNIHALDLAGEQMIHALNDAHRMRR